MKKSEKYQESISTIKIATKEDVELNPLLKLGKEFIEHPAPQNKKEAIERFQKHNAQRVFESLQLGYYEKYGKLIIRTINDELKDLNSFINTAENEFSTKKANEEINGNTRHPYDKHLEYLRLKYGYYEKRKYIGYYTFYTSSAVEVYARYFLYKDWLKAELQKLENPFKIDYTELMNELEKIGAIETTDANNFNKAMNGFESNDVFIIWNDGSNARRFTKAFFYNERNVFNKYFRIRNNKKEEIKMRTNHVGEISNAPSDLKVILEKWQKK